jgi:hypothetical protein
MFSLSAEDLRALIVDCASGPSSFNCEMTNLGGHVISCDPIYALSKLEIEQRINETRRLCTEELNTIKENYGFNAFKVHNDVMNLRFSAMDVFLDDYEKGKDEQRYVFTELPKLTIDSDQFQIALCSNFLFTYTHILTLKFHLDSIREMVRIANEVRIFPVFSLDGRQSDYLETICETLSKENYIVQLQTVNYEIQKGANQMLKVKRVLP